MTSHVLDNQGSDLSMGRDLYVLHSIQTRSGAHPVDTGDSFPGGKVTRGKGSLLTSN